jgi:predicted RNA-binding protein with PUA-like domain
MKPWLMKSEPDVYAIHDLERDGETAWEGVRNYQARNFLRDQAKVGDQVLFYHSNAEPPGVAGLARVCSPARPDPSQFDPTSPYHDPGATREEPRWWLVDIAFVERFPAVVGLPVLKADPTLAGLEVTRRGTRLSVHPVSDAHFERIVALGRAGA